MTDTLPPLDDEHCFAIGRQLAASAKEHISTMITMGKLDDKSQRKIFFATLHQFVIEVFALAPTVVPYTDEQRLHMFDSFVAAVREDFVRTIHRSHIVTKKETLQ